MQGVECADHVIFGTMEITVNLPGVVNGSAQRDRVLQLEPRPGPRRAAKSPS